jgi:hypothetical protein
VFFAAGLLFAVAFPYHDWDAFAYGGWSTQIATSHSFDPAPYGAPPASRPVFLVLQGLVWWVTGPSFVAGRLLSLGFAVVAALGTALLLAKRSGRLFALLAFLSITYFAAEAIAGKTDVPAAAAVAAIAGVGLHDAFRRQRLAIAVLGAVAVLTKPSSVIPALFGLALALAVVEYPRLRSVSQIAHSRAAALLLGGIVGLGYDWTMANHLHMGLVGFLRSGTTGYYAQAASAARADTLLRLDFLGADLRLPLAFALVYACCRTARVGHRQAAIAGIVAGGGYALIGPYLAAGGGGPFTDAYSGFAFIGFAALLSVTPFAEADLVPDRIRMAQLLLIAVPPSVVWATFGIYENRLEAPAWPPLAALIGACLYCAVRTAHRLAGVAALAAIPVLAVALWASLVSIDGFHGPMWDEFRSLGVSGLSDTNRTTNIVLPAVSETVATLKSQIGGNGRVVASDPRFVYWFDRTTYILTPTSCKQLNDADGFILSISDEATLMAQHAGGSDDPAWWQACKQPKLRELTDGSNGFAAFVVEH